MPHYTKLHDIGTLIELHTFDDMTGGKNIIAHKNITHLRHLHFYRNMINYFGTKLYKIEVNLI